jgi:hypothetical protein
MIMNNEFVFGFMCGMVFCSILVNSLWVIAMIYNGKKSEKKDREY